MFLSANFRLEGKAVSDRSMRKLNQRNWGVCVFHSNVKHMCGKIRTKCEQVSQKDNILVFSMSIDATKCPKSLNTNTTRKCVMGGDFPNHMMSTQHLGKECMQKFFENKCAEDDNKEAIELS